LSEHPIQGLMKTAMESIKEMVDVNTVVGDPVDTPDGSVIIPVSRVSFGFAAGGTDFENRNGRKGSGNGQEGGEIPFGGGSGAGVSVQPVGFLVVGQGTVRLLSVEGGAIFDRLIDAAPNLLNNLQNLIRGGGNGPREQKQATTEY